MCEWMHCMYVYVNTCGSSASQLKKKTKRKKKCYEFCIFMRFVDSIASDSLDLVLCALFERNHSLQSFAMIEIKNYFTFIFLLDRKMLGKTKSFILILNWEKKQLNSFFFSFILGLALELNECVTYTRSRFEQNLNVLKQETMYLCFWAVFILKSIICSINFILAKLLHVLISHLAIDFIFLAQNYRIFPF